jgi:hypothetical protein
MRRRKSLVGGEITSSRDGIWVCLSIPEYPGNGRLIHADHLRLFGDNVVAVRFHIPNHHWARLINEVRGC